jgi:hypothetical protein
MFLRVHERPVVFSVAGKLVVAILGTLVVNHLGLEDLVLEHRNDLAAVVALVDFLTLICRGRLLLINLDDLLLLLLDSSI